MWNLDLEKLLPYVGPGGWGRIAVETGTCRGNGARYLAKRFGRVITIELSEELHAAAQARLKGEGLSVECLRGNSAEVLAHVLPELAGEPVFFFLDAHWSGDSTVPWEQSDWKGYGVETAHLGTRGKNPGAREQCPLAEELKVIMELQRGPAWVLIDDISTLGAPPRFPGESWEHLSKEILKEILRPRTEALHELASPEQWLVKLRALE